MQQVSRRVAAERQLRKHDQIRPGLVGTLPSLGDLFRVAVEISDGGVDLSDSDFHLLLGQGIGECRVAKVRIVP